MAVKKTLSEEVTMPASALHNAIKVDAQGHVTVSNKDLATLIKDHVAANPSIGPSSTAAISVGVVVGT